LQPIAETTVPIIHHKPKPEYVHEESPWTIRRLFVNTQWNYVTGAVHPYQPMAPEPWTFLGGQIFIRPTAFKGL